MQSDDISSPDVVERQPGGAFKLQFVLQSIRSAFPNLSPKDVAILDIGCGSGQFSMPLGVAGFRVHAIDTFAPRIEAARRLAPATVNLEVRNAYELASIGAQYNVVMCLEIIEHLDEPLKFLLLARALLAKDGILIVTVPNGYSLIEATKRIKNSLKRTSIGKKILGLKRRFKPISEKALASQHDGDLHKQYFTARKIAVLIDRAGFRVKHEQAAGPLYSFLNPLGIVTTQSSFFPGFDHIDSMLGNRTPRWIAGGWYFVCEIKDDKCAER